MCDLAIERHFKKYIKSSDKYQFTYDSADTIATLICEALVKDLENEIWHRIAPKMMTRVDEMKRLAMDATGKNKRI